MHKQFTSFLSQRLGIDADYLFRSGFWVTFRYSMVSVIGLATTIMFTRMVSQEVYGAYQYILAFVSFFSFFSLPGLNVAALKAVVKGNDRALFQAIKWSFFSGLLGIPCIIGYGLYHHGEQEISIALLSVTALAFAPFYALNTWYVFYEGRKDFFSVAWRAIFSTLATFIALGTAILLGASIAEIVATYFAVGIVTSAVFSTEIWLRLKKESSHPSDDALDIRYGVAVTGQKLVLNASETLPLMAIGSVYGFVEVALFQVALFVYSSISGYIGALIAMYFPQLFSGTRLEGKKTVTHTILSGVLIASGMGIFLSAVFPYLFGEEYRESVRIAWYLLPIVVFLPLKTYLTSYFTANHQVMFTGVSYLIGNCLAGISFYFAREEGVGVAGSVYVGILVISVTLFMLARYFLETASRKTASI